MLSGAGGAGSVARMLAGCVARNSVELAQTSLAKAALFHQTRVSRGGTRNPGIRTGVARAQQPLDCMGSDSDPRERQHLSKSLATIKRLAQSQTVPELSRIGNVLKTPESTIDPAFRERL
jgi:hypothetical protein